MKKYILLFSLLAGTLFTFTGCDNTNVWEEEQYIRQAYLVGIGEEGALMTRTVDYASANAEVLVSVAISGSLKPDHDVHCTLVEAPEGITTYNQQYKSVTDIQYRALPAGHYSMPSMDVVIPAGQATASIPVTIKTEGLHCDSLYALPLKMKSCGEYSVAAPETVVLFAIQTSNPYAGYYNYIGSDSKGQSFSLVRNAVAVDKNTIRIYHSGVEELAKVNDTGLTITINKDNTLSLAGWKNLNVTNGSGTYSPETRQFSFEYDINGEHIEAVLVSATSEED